MAAQIDGLTCAQGILLPSHCMPLSYIRLWGGPPHAYLSL